MDFRLSEDQLMFKKMFADFCTKEIRPRASTSTRPRPTGGSLRKAVDQGFWAALVPEELDGPGLDTYTYMLMLEELARADLSTAFTQRPQQPGGQAGARFRHGRTERTATWRPWPLARCWAPLPWESRRRIRHRCPLDQPAQW
jgi:alkylation response protein AidB-like acyl-CoA dehydrogenase